MIKIAGVDWEILRILKLMPMRNIDIVKSLKTDKGTISKAVSMLEVMGLIERDGKMISLTKTGEWYADFYKKVKNNGAR